MSIQPGTPTSTLSIFQAEARKSISSKQWALGQFFFDYNNDDFQDLYIVNIGPVPDALEVNTEVTVQRPATNALYRNNGDGTFTDVTERAGVGDTGYGMGKRIIKNNIA